MMIIHETYYYYVFRLHIILSGIIKKCSDISPKKKSYLCLVIEQELQYSQK